MSESYCVDCGLPVGDGQRTCSMCYGDPGHGTDGYYQRWLDEQDELEAAVEADYQRQVAEGSNEQF